MVGRLRLTRQDSRWLCLRLFCLLALRAAAVLRLVRKTGSVRSELIEEEFVEMRL